MQFLPFLSSKVYTQIHNLWSPGPTFVRLNPKTRKGLILSYGTQKLRKIFSVTPIFGVEFSMEDKQSDGKENFVPRQEARAWYFGGTVGNASRTELRTMCRLWRVMTLNPACYISVGPTAR